MKDGSFITYKIYQNKDLATEYVDILKSNNIEFLIEDISNGLIPGFENNDLSHEIRLKVKIEDFEKAEKVILNYNESLISKINRDYYLFDFTDEELIEIIEKKDEWDDFDYVLSIHILESRGVIISDEFLKEVKNKNTDSIQNPQDSNRVFIYLAYISPVFGGFFGVILGLVLTTHKITLPNKEKIYGFSENDRRHGRRIIILGLITLFLFVLKFFWTKGEMK